MGNQKIMRLKDAAKELETTSAALSYHVKRGRIRAIKIPGSKRISGVLRSDVEAILANCGKEVK